MEEESVWYEDCYGARAASANMQALPVDTTTGSLVSHSVVCFLVRFRVGVCMDCYDRRWKGTQNTNWHVGSRAQKKDILIVLFRIVYQC